MRHVEEAGNGDAFCACPLPSHPVTEAPSCPHLRLTSLVFESGHTSTGDLCLGPEVAP